MPTDADTPEYPAIEPPADVNIGAAENDAAKAQAIAPAPRPDFLAVLAAETGVDINAVRNAPPLDHEALSRKAISEARAKSRREQFEHDIGAGYRESDWTHPKMQPWREQIDRVIGWQVSPKGLLLSGPTGRGKTRSLAALYRRLAIDEGHEVFYTNASDWFARLQTWVNYGRDDARGWVHAQAKRQIFILDDIGQEAVSTARADWAQAWLFRFLDLRREHALPLLASTNLSSAQIAGTSEKSAIRQEPLLRRLLDLCEVINFGERPSRPHNPNC
ncbi:hypothetical protein OPIT5_03885 [Opitutaceae bacterium TAV5]|nr:hypothetical protein OPIT5_03885 [Opitutaceae bacterium TAV5]